MLDDDELDTVLKPRLDEVDVPLLTELLDVDVPRDDVPPWRKLELPDVDVPLFTVVVKFVDVLPPRLTVFVSLADDVPTFVVVTRYLLSLFTPVDVEPPFVGRVFPLVGRVTVAEP